MKRNEKNENLVCFFLFFFVVSFFFFFFLSQVSRRGITCIWFSIEKMVLGIKNLFFSFFFFFSLFFSSCVFLFPFFSFFNYFLTKNAKQMRKNWKCLRKWQRFKRKKQEQIKKCQHTHLIECQIECQDVYQLDW